MFQKKVTCYSLGADSLNNDQNKVENKGIPTCLCREWGNRGGENKAAFFCTGNNTIGFLVPETVTIQAYNVRQEVDEDGKPGKIVSTTLRAEKLELNAKSTIVIPNGGSVCKTTKDVLQVDSSELTQY